VKALRCNYSDIGSVTYVPGRPPGGR